MITLFESTWMQMFSTVFRVAAVTILVAASLPCLASDPVAADHRIETPTRNFSLPATDHSIATLSRDPSVKFHVLCFVGTECPLARLYGSRLEKMFVEFAPQGVQFIGINSNIQDSMDELRKYVNEHALTFPVAKDYDRRVALDFGATRTPEVFVIDRSGVIRYRGRIDDQYEPGVKRDRATKHDLRDALQSLVAGEGVVTSSTDAVGCLIALPRGISAISNVTYCNQIARVFQSHCIECHREGEIGPFSLEQYEDAVGWADMSLEVIDQGRMPPWHASDNHAELANARAMPGEDKELIRQWVESGLAYGNPTELPPSVEYVSGWRLPRMPDQILKMSEIPFEVPAGGTVEYQYYVVDPGFKEDKWVHAAQVIPGNASVVHHCIAFTRPPDGADFRDIGLLAAYVPGQVRRGFPEGFAQRVPAGSRIVFQMHYTPTGKTETDLTRIGLVFSDPDEVTHEVFALGGVEQEFEIPPGASNYQVDGDISWFPRDGMLLSVMPHMHLRGKSYRFEIESDGQTETLLEVPRYDFNWQHNYELSTPLMLEKIDRLGFSAIFDNSDQNPFNPDPTEHVTWGDQTWQEMAVTFISVAIPRDAAQLDSDPGDNGGASSASAGDTPSDQQPSEIQRHAASKQAARESKAEEFATRYIERFDANGDGYIASHELPHSVRLFAFWSFDHNGDSQISRDEIKAESLWRLPESP